jgi:hypothetical protein
VAFSERNRFRILDVSHCLAPETVSLVHVSLLIETRTKTEAAGSLMPTAKDGRHREADCYCTGACQLRTSSLAGVTSANCDCLIRYEPA